MQSRFASSVCYRPLQLVLMLYCLLLQAPAQAEDWVYTVRPGDNLWDICARYVKSPDCWREVAERNKVANPRQIPPGTRLYLPVEWLKARVAQAAVLAFEGDVEVLLRGVHPEEVRRGLLLSVGDEIVVRDGSLQLRFGDGSQLSISPHSRVKLDTLTVYGDIGMADTRVRLDRGRARATVQPSKSGASRFQVITPAAVAAARGTEFRVVVDDEQVLVMRTEVIAGEVSVADQEFAQPVHAGQAVNVTLGQGVGKPVALLAAPQLRQAIPAEISLFPWTLAWHEIPDAEQYRLEMYRVNEQRSRFGDYLLDQAEVSFDYLEEGTYELFVRGVDAQEFEGFDLPVTLRVARPAVVNTPSLSARRNVREDPHTVYWSWQSEERVPYYELAITALCDGQETTRFERVQGDSYVSSHPGCAEVSAQVAPWVQGQSHARSEPVEVALTQKSGLWSVILLALALTLMAL